MKRAPIVLSGTALGLAGVLGYHASAKPSTLVTTSKSSTTAVRTTASSGQTRSATGEDVSFRYGDLQLKVTVSGKRVTDVSVVQANPNDPRSQSIDQDALPQLRDQALSAQSARIDGVSGASYTSQAYEQSLQSALDKLGVA